MKEGANGMKIGAIFCFHAIEFDGRLAIALAVHEADFGP